jgi:hypothetical protein
MRPEELKALMRRRPFMPVRIYLTDGTTYDVQHPDMVIVLKSRVDIGVPADPSEDIAERVDHCSLLHVVRVEDLNGSHSTPSN